jgi:N-acetylglutamate synthase-like GNAT family acetyltransferase
LQVKKVNSTNLKSAYCCIPAQSPYATGLTEAKEWFETNLNEHVEGYHLLDETKVVGHIYFAMSEKAFIPYDLEPGVACIYCTYLLSDYLHKGLGRMMFDYMKKDLESQAVKGIMVPATEFKEWMHYELFTKQGFRTIKEHSPYKVMYFPLTQEEINVIVLSLNYEPSEDKVEVTFFKSFFCPVSPFMYNRIKKVAQNFGDKVKIVEMEGTFENMRKYGTKEPLINGKIKLYGPASEEDIMKSIEEEIVEFNRKH